MVAGDWFVVTAAVAKSVCSSRSTDTTVPVEQHHSNPVYEVMSIYVITQSNTTPS